MSSPKKFDVLANAKAQLTAFKKLDEFTAKELIDEIERLRGGLQVIATASDPTNWNDDRVSFSNGWETAMLSASWIAQEALAGRLT